MKWAEEPDPYRGNSKRIASGRIRLAEKKWIVERAANGIFFDKGAPGQRESGATRALPEALPEPLPKPWG